MENNIVETTGDFSEDSELGTIPDISVPSDWLIWRSTLRVGLLVELPPMDPKFAQNMVTQLKPGLKGRGTCSITPEGRLFISFGITADEAKSDDIMIGYAALLVRHFGLPYESVIDHGIGEINPPAEVMEEVDRTIRQIGLRAVSKIK